MMEKTCKMLKEPEMNERFWAEAIKNVAYSYNTTISPVLSMKSRQESLLGNAPNNEQIKILACAAYTFMHKLKKICKRDDRADVGVFLGMTNGLYRI